MSSSVFQPASTPAANRRPVRVAYLVSHPIQYQAPMLRRLAREPWLDLTVFFGSDFSVRGYEDAGFGVEVKWDVPLLEGYRHEFLPALRDNSTAGVLSPISRGLLSRLQGRGAQEPFDLLWVHGYSTANTLLAMLTAKFLGIPVLLRAESWLSDRPRTVLRLAAKRLYFAFLRHLVDGVLAIGSRNTEYWRYYFGGDFPIFQMPYAVDNDFFQQRSCEAAAGSDALRAELGLEPGRPVILFASKLQKRKHCDDLIDAYARLVSFRSNSPAPYLLIVGDGEERGNLQQQAARTGLPSICFCGFVNQSQLPRYLHLCTVFVLPSQHEPWGLIVNEAMNAGRPVIVSNNVGCQVDLVTDGVEGCVYPVRDVAALADALQRVLALPGAAEAMGANALKRISRWNFEADVLGLRQAVAHVTRSSTGAAHT